MLERMEKIRSLGGEHAAEVLEGLYREMLAAKELATSGKTADIKDFQGRDSDFKKALIGFEQIYKTDTFKNLSVVFSYLTEQGYKIANRTIYQHRDEGKLKADASGQYLKKDVDEYAEKYLGSIEKEVRESGSIVDRKNEAEIKLKQIRAEREQILIDEAMGRLIPREAVGREFAARIEEIKRSFEEIESSLPVIIVGKDEKEIREAIKSRHDYILEQYSRKLETIRK